MADRTVKVDLVANVARYNTSVENAAERTERLNREADRFDGRRLSARAQVHTGKSEADLARLNAELNRINGRKATATARVDTKSGLASVGALAGGIAALGPAAAGAAIVATGAIGGMTTYLGVGAAAAVTAGLAFAGMGDAISAAADGDTEKLNEALKGMDVSARSFATTVAGLKPQLDQLRRTAQGGLLPGAEEGIKSLANLMPTFNNLIGKTSQALGELAQKGGAALDSPFWREYFDFLANEARPTLLGFGAILGNFAEGFAGLQMAFAPVARDMISGLKNLSESFAEWATTLDTNQGFQDFIDYVRTNGPLLVSTLGSVAESIGALIGAMAPFAPIVLQAIKGLAEALTALMSSDAGPWIVGLAAAIGSLVLASKGIVGVAATLRTMGTALALVGLRGPEAAAAARNAGAGITTMGGAATTAAGSTSRFGTVAGAVGRNLPLVGAAVIGLAAAHDMLNVSASEGASAMTDLSAAGAATREEMERNDATMRRNQEWMPGWLASLEEWNRETFGLQTTTAMANAEFERQVALMPPLEASQARVTQAQAVLNDAIRDYGATSPQAIAASQRLAEANAMVSVQQQLAGQTGQQYLDTLRGLANQGGAVGAAANQIVQGLNAADLAAIGATQSTDQFGKTVTMLDGRVVRVEFDANVQPANEQVTGWSQRAEATTGQARFDADPNPAFGQSWRWNTETQQLEPVPAVFADIDPATGESRRWNAETQQMEPVPRVDADTSAADDRSQTWERNSDAMRPEASLDAETSGADQAAQGFWNTWAGRTITWFVNLVGGNARGGIWAQGMANGGVVDAPSVIANAPGNEVSPYNRTYQGKKLRTMPNTGARMVPPNTWRVVGDRLDVPELYAPLDGSGRSRSLIAQGAATFGMSLVDTDTLSKLTGHKYGHAKPASVPQPVAAEARAVSSNIKGDHTVNNTVNVNNPIAERGSDSVQRSLSRLADFGLFGDD